jgi:hypothetical protein
MKKTICKKKKEKETPEPRFKCGKCKHVAKKKKDLCQPEKL